MKKTAIISIVLIGILLAGLANAAPVRVALLDFENQTGATPDAKLGGSVNPASLTAKGPFLLGQKLAGNPAYSLIDRRDFISQVESQQYTDAGEPTTAKPSFLHAAQALRADAVIRGTILSYDTGKQTVNQGGYKSEFATTTMRVGLQALDAVDGTVLAMTDGAGSIKLRQTDALQTELSEDQIVDLMNKALNDAVPQLSRDISSWQNQRAERPRMKVSVRTNDEPALVEIDGILVGSTPLENFEVYQGDHILRVNKPGYQDMTKRILVDADMSIEVPMLRIDLTADEVYEIYKNAQLSIFEGVEPALVIDRVRPVAP